MQILAPDLSARPRIAVQLAPFASATILEGVTLQLRWRDAEDLSAWNYGETVTAGEYNLTTRALDEGETRARAVDGLATGVYIYRLRSGDRIQSRKLLLLR